MSRRTRVDAAVERLQRRAASAERSGEEFSSSGVGLYREKEGHEDVSGYTGIIARGLQTVLGPLLVVPVRKNCKI